MNIILRSPELKDGAAFLAAMNSSNTLHAPWVKPPMTPKEFEAYLKRYQQDNNKSYLLIDADAQAIAGVFHLNEIVRGAFQCAYLGYYSVSAYAGKGYMSEGLKQLLHKAFVELELHRLEANIQPGNQVSIHLVRQNGFCLEGYSPRYLKINNEWRDHERWALTHEDWLLFASELYKNYSKKIDK